MPDLYFSHCVTLITQTIEITDSEFPINPPPERGPWCHSHTTMISLASTHFCSLVLRVITILLKTPHAACVTEHVLSHLTSARAYLHPYVRVLDKLVHVDALRVEDSLLLAVLGCGFAE